MAKYKRGHGSKKGVINSILEKVWNWELRKIKAKEKIGFGGSCFVVGKKVPNKE